MTSPRSLPTSPCELSEREVTSPSNLKVVGALDNYSLVFVIFINFFGQLKDWVGQVLFLVSCPKGQVEKYVNVEAWRHVRKVVAKYRCNLYKMHYEDKLKSRSYSTSFCLIEVVIKAGLTVLSKRFSPSETKIAHCSHVFVYSLSSINLIGFFLWKLG